MSLFDLKSEYSPAGDQPEAIRQIKEAFDAGENKITLMGATGTGKTFTMANIIQSVQKTNLDYFSQQDIGCSAGDRV